MSVAGESSLWVDPAEIASGDDIARLGRALGGEALGKRDELMANVAAYSGLSWGEIAASPSRKSVRPPGSSPSTVKVVKVGGRQYVEAPKNRESRRTIYARWLSAG
jgi:hypothetical protein